MSFWDKVKDVAGELAGKSAAFMQEVRNIQDGCRGMSDSELISIFKQSRKGSAEWFAVGIILEKERGYDLKSL